MRGKQAGQPRPPTLPPAHPATHCCSYCPRGLHLGELSSPWIKAGISCSCFGAQLLDSVLHSLSPLPQQCLQQHPQHQQGARSPYSQYQQTPSTVLCHSWLPHSVTTEVTGNTKRLSLNVLFFPFNRGELGQQKRLFYRRKAGSNLASKAPGSSR